MPSIRTLLRALAPFLFALSPWSPLPAQDGDGLPTEYVVQVPPGGHVDLDSGVILPAPAHRGFRADLRFGRDGEGFYLEPLVGGTRARPSDTEPPSELAKDRVRIRRDDAGALVMFVRTDRGMARVQLMVVDPYSTASAALRWVVVPPKKPVFLPAPTDLQAAWRGASLELSWSGDEPRWLVEVRTGDAVRKVTVDAPRANVGGLDPKGVHHVVVRGLSAENEPGMPAMVVQHGARKPPEQGIVVYEDRWYDASGGMSLTTGAVAGERAEVVFYLYGVHVPGGGVLKVGNGDEDTFEALRELPAGPFPPTYGRLDERDVLVVQLADGRYGKLWLAPMRGDDVRSGMRVHFVFLPDGRRTLLPAPRELASSRTAHGTQLTWQASDRAASYRVTIARGVPREVKEPTCVLNDLPPDRMVEVQVAAVAADGEQSAWTRLLVSTHALELRAGRGAVTAQDGGFVFATGERTAAAAPCDLQLVGGAGGAQSLTFAGAGSAGAGIAPAPNTAFGEFAAAERLEFVPQLESRVDRAGADLFFVRCRDGSLACVHLLRRDWPTTTFEYVWQPKP
jgi:hypothetical protein